MKGDGRSKWLVLGLALYLLLLIASHWRSERSDAPLPVAMHSVSLVEEPGSSRAVRFAWREWGESGGGELPIVLLHGSPGSHGDFRRLAPALAQERLVLAPDLPGFGASSRRVVDYSIRSHARWVGDWLEAKGVERAHILGFSMGGGVALELAELHPERVASLTLLSAIGVQEMELLGSYALNHALHGLQLGGLWLLHNAVPHMGALDGFPLDVPCARNFYDTDQRPLRAALEAWQGPLLILHGRNDFLVPPEAAIEHHRIVPQSELVMLDTDHFFVFRGRPDVAPEVADFVQRVDTGLAVERLAAPAERLAAARRPFDPESTPRWVGPALLVAVLLLALSTAVSEDLACIGAGLLVAEGRLGFAAAVFGCFAGIFIGDLLIFAAGRVFGRPAVRRAPLRWWLSERAIAESSAWFTRRGGAVVVLSRFLPGTRVPTYFSAGVLRVSSWRFTLFLLAAVAIWTPLLVFFSQIVGQAALERLAVLQESALLLLLVPLALFLIFRKLLLPLLTWEGRRYAVGALRRWSRWEFWPFWIFYPPVAAYIVYLGVRHRGLTVFTAANPALPAGGFIGESKAEILTGLASAGEVVPAWCYIGSGTIADRLEEVRRFVEERGGALPVVLKPDAGQRGEGVAIVRDLEHAESHLREHAEPFIVQEFVGGREFGVFYYRFPGEAAGRIFSITEKRTPTVVGDGTSTVEQLILGDRRAVAMARVYFRELGEERFRVPAPGEQVELTQVGAHSRGTLFLDGTHHRTEALRGALDEITACFAGFHFGRYDVKVPSAEHLEAGREIRVLELNGVTAEATDIYDPRNGALHAWGELMRQWSLAFRVGAACRDRGARPVPPVELLRLVVRHRDQVPW
jgi:pimeloyl-ACP methyl ester carboxylesterase/membrane protein DedA with SNARE-associated domain